MHASSEFAASTFHEAPAAGAESLLSKVMRFLFPVKLLKDPHGDMFLQSSIMKANLAALRRHSMHYVRVHTIITALLLAFVTLAASAGPAVIVAGLALVVPEITVLIILASIALAAHVD